MNISVLDEVVSIEDVKNTEKVYVEQLQIGQVLPKTQFAHALNLIRTRQKDDIKRGLELLQELFKSSSDDLAKRDYLYYLAVGNARLAEYEKAFKYIDAIDSIESGNKQVDQLKKDIKKRQHTEQIIGAAAIGAAAIVGVGGLITLGLAVMSRK